MSELKPCPFCGSDDIVVRSAEPTGQMSEYEHGICNKCHAIGPLSWTDPYKRWNTRPTDTRIAELEAEVQRLRAGAKIKPLVWRDAKVSDRRQRQTAACFFGNYEALEWSDGGFGATYPAYEDGLQINNVEEQERLPTLESAKAAAQADYEARILSALVQL